MKNCSEETEKKSGNRLKGKERYNWKGGIYKNRGYLRYSAGKYRHRYVHTVEIEKVIKNSPIGLMFIGLEKIPGNLDTHHTDYCKSHNCLGNLMLLDESIHGWISNQRKNCLERLKNERAKEWYGI